ncbi:hypothetical protein GF361_02615, partial [Candidatus Woesearchaeota archaeon]|nr:hypothetical protein [Candidatus Woesearchaeota archaeon]
MPTQDTSKIKEKIISFLRAKGPSLPVHIAKEIGTDTLFASAFLSELISDRKIKTSNMKVGSSSLHYLKGQEQKLENFSKHLNPREREAFELIKDNKFLKDSELQPVMRVAMRSIKDFAIPFKKNNEIYWRYFSVPESEFPEKEQQQEKEPPKQEQQQEEKEQEKES